MVKAAFDGGHGGFGVTPGKRTPDGEYEWHFNNEVVVAAIEVLKAHGVDVLRTDDPTGRTDVSLASRVNKANRWGADVFVSVHHNANTGRYGNWTGTETFVYTGASAGSLKLAKCVHPKLVDAMGLRDRGIKKANFYVIRKTNMPAILTEGGYMDSYIDIKKMRDKQVLRNAGINIARGVLEYFGIAYKGTAVAGVSTSKASNENKGYLEKGDVNEEVRKLQEKLSFIGIECEVTGAFDDSTLTAVLLLQKRKGLSADGLAGKNTMDVLDKLVEEKDEKGTYRIYTGTFGDEEALNTAVEEIGYNAFAKEGRVWTGAFASLFSATAAKNEIAKNHGYNPQIRKES